MIGHNMKYKWPSQEDKYQGTLDPLCILTILTTTQFSKWSTILYEVSSEIETQKQLYSLVSCIIVFLWYDCIPLILLYSSGIIILHCSQSLLMDQAATLNVNGHSRNI